jgi:hypothetical protein
MQVPFGHRQDTQAFPYYRFVNSTFIQYVAYDVPSARLRVIIQPKSPDEVATGYDYELVSPTVYQGLALAPSVGAYFSRNIRGHYKSTRLSPKEVTLFMAAIAQREYSNGLLRL